ncbi:MAG: hypothetical protein QXT58_02180 [Archaeoglobaceae archaeon]
MKYYVVIERKTNPLREKVVGVYKRDGNILKLLSSFSNSLPKEATLLGIKAWNFTSSSLVRRVMPISEYGIVLQYTFDCPCGCGLSYLHPYKVKVVNGKVDFDFATDIANHRQFRSITEHCSNFREIMERELRSIYNM